MHVDLANDMKFAAKPDGTVSVQITARTWIKVIVLVAIAVWGHAQLQSNRIDALGSKMHDTSIRLEATEKSVTEFKEDFRHTTEGLQADIRELNTLMRSRSSISRSASPVATTGN